MPKKSFTEEQIVPALREAESGVPIVEVCRRVGVTETTFFNYVLPLAEAVRRTRDRRVCVDSGNWRTKIGGSSRW
jgi:hypothetical protein